MHHTYTYLVGSVMELHISLLQLSIVQMKQHP